MMFPTEKGDLTDETFRAERTGGKVFKFDYVNKSFNLIDGKPEEFSQNDTIGLVTQWVELLLKTDVNKFKVYKNTDFGISTGEVIGLKNVDKSLANAILEQDIREKVKLNPLILGVDNFNFYQNNQELKITFSVILLKGGSFDVTAVRN